MKSFLFLLVLSVFCAVGAVGQTGGGVLNAEPQMFQMTGHPQEAKQQQLGQERDIMERSVNGYSQGERPLWEVMQEAPPMPVASLGELARAARKEHALAKKAAVVWTN